MRSPRRPRGMTSKMPLAAPAMLFADGRAAAGANRKCNFGSQIWRVQHETAAVAPGSPPPLGKTAYRTRCGGTVR